MEKQIILLNGPSSSGKSTLAKVLKEQINVLKKEEYVIVSIDDFMNLSSEEVIYEDDVYEISGKMCEKVLEILKTSSGVIIDHVITSERIYKELIEMLAKYHIIKVRVTCPLNVLRKREEERKNRHLGSAEASDTYLFPKDGYDLIVNTHLMTKEECAIKILDVLL